MLRPAYSAGAMPRSSVARAALAAAFLAAASGGALAATTKPPPKLRVTPARGGVRTTFAVRFKAPDASGIHGVRQVTYELSAAPGRTPRGCIGSVSYRPQASRAGQVVVVRLKPRRLGGHWCVTVYTGQVDETVGPYCPPPSAGGTPAPCPEFVTLLRRIGTFKFAVRR